MVGSKLVIIATLEIEVKFDGGNTAEEIRDREVARMVDALVTNYIKMQPFEGEIVRAEFMTYRAVRED